MSLIKAIIDHGDLTDVAFTEKTFGAKFALSYFGLSPEGKQDTEGLLYQSNQILGAPINETVWVHTSTASQAKFDLIAQMSIDSQSFSKSNSDFMRYCLRIPVSNFYSFFGGHFFGGVINGVGAATEEMVDKRKTRSRISLSISYNPRDHLVSHVGIDQRPITAE